MSKPRAHTTPQLRHSGQLFAHPRLDLGCACLIFLYYFELQLGHCSSQLQSAPHSVHWVYSSHVYTILRAPTSTILESSSHGMAR